MSPQRDKQNEVTGRPREEDQSVPAGECLYGSGKVYLHCVWNALGRQLLLSSARTECNRIEMLFQEQLVEAGFPGMTPGSVPWPRTKFRACHHRHQPSGLGLAGVSTRSHPEDPSPGVYLHSPSPLPFKTDRQVQGHGDDPLRLTLGPTLMAFLCRWHLIRIPGRFSWFRMVAPR